MDNSLKILIDYYEEEKKRLLQQIDDYTKEWEYQFAHFHSLALFQIQHKLKNLYSLEDPAYGQKEMKQNSIRYLEKMLHDGPDYIREYFSGRLQQAKSELEELSKIEPPVSDPQMGNMFEEIVKRLLARDINGFALFLSYEDNFALNFSCGTRSLKVVVPHIKRHLKTGMLSDENILVLQEMGFAVNKNQTRLILLLQISPEAILHEINWRLAKIVFDLFYFPSFKGKSCIVIKEKPNAN